MKNRFVRFLLLIYQELMHISKKLLKSWKLLLHYTIKNIKLLAGFIYLLTQGHIKLIKMDSYIVIFQINAVHS